MKIITNSLMSCLGSGKLKISKEIFIKLVVIENQTFRF